MGKSFWDTVNEPCLAFEFRSGEDDKKEDKKDKEEIKLLRQEIKELKQLVNMRKVKSIEGDCRMLE